MFQTQDFHQTFHPKSNRVDFLLDTYKDDEKECMNVLYDDCRQYEYGYFTEIFTHDELWKLLNYIYALDNESYWSLFGTISCNPDCEYFLVKQNLNGTKAFPIQTSEEMACAIRYGQL